MNEYIRWTKSEEDINYVGVLTGETDTHVRFLTKCGEFEVEKTDGEFSEATREDFDVSETPVKTDSNAVETTARSGSKMEMAIEIFKRMNGSTRKNIIAAFKAELNMSDAGASTYYQTIKSKQK